MVEASLETLSFRQIGVVIEEYAVVRRHQDVGPARP